MISLCFVLLLTSLSTTLANNINVQVGSGGSITYNPSSVNANPGDVVTFTFLTKNHTVTQSSFGTPCNAISGGFNTGFVPVGTGPPVSTNFTVPSGNSPLWFYCGQPGHCGMGMVFAINAPPPPAANSFNNFQAAAIAQNGTASLTMTLPQATSAPPSTVTTEANFTTPPPPVFSTATATVTFGSSTYTTVYTSYLGTPPPTPAPNPQDHMIVVGFNGTLSYNPPNISAAIGDTVTFQFHPKNHTVTQSNFLTPCEKLQKPDGTLGFSSGFMPVNATSTDFPTFQITINDTAPIWGYCGQPGHCPQGMVFSINAVESGPNNFEAFQQLALHSNDTGAASMTAVAPGTSPTGTTSDALGPRVGLPLSFALMVFGVIVLML